MFITHYSSAVVNSTQPLVLLYYIASQLPPPLHPLKHGTCTSRRTAGLLARQG